MIGDILAVLWKEGIELLHMRGSARSTTMVIIFPVFFIGIVLPLQLGRLWVESPASLIAWAWMPLLFTITVIGDSVAGEKERHTLETLLASRLPDIAILFGKLLASILYALGLTALIILTGMVTVNIANYGKGFLLFHPLYFAVGGLIVLLISVLASTAGIIVSLKARTVRQALQTLSFGIMIVSVLPIFLFNFLPIGFRKQAFSFLNMLDSSLLLASILGALIVADCLLLAAAIRRFRRNRLLTE